MTLTKSSPTVINLLAICMGMGTLFIWLYFTLFFPFAFQIIPEGYRVRSPIEMFQGAPLSHYHEEHGVALWLYEATRSIPGTVAFAVFFLCMWWVWASLFLRFSGSRARFATTVAICELVILILNIPHTAISAFHHVGWGMPCNSQPVWCFLLLNLILSPVTLYLVVRSYAMKGSAPSRWLPPR